jgi:hypothetical protein
MGSCLKSSGNRTDYMLSRRTAVILNMHIGGIRIEHNSMFIVQETCGNGGPY